LFSQSPSALFEAYGSDFTQLVDNVSAQLDSQGKALKGGESHSSAWNEGRGKEGEEEDGEEGTQFGWSELVRLWA